MMTSWFLILVLFLWVAGGFGWVDSYEAREQTDVDWVRGGLMVLFWPALAVVVASGELWQTFRHLKGTE